VEREADRSQPVTGGNDMMEKTLGRDQMFEGLGERVVELDREPGTMRIGSSWRCKMTAQRDILS